MKGEVPVVLLNQWLNVEMEKSHFAKGELCNSSSYHNFCVLVHEDEYSVYSEDTIMR